jgi:hypothetical protein
MIETVVALCMFLNGELHEHRIKDKMSDCLKGKRVAERNHQSTSVQYSCDTVEAEISVDSEGYKHIEKIIEDENDKKKNN